MNAKNIYLFACLCLTTLICSCEKKVDDSSKPTFIDPLPPLTSVILAEQNTDFELKFGYYDNVRVNTILIEIAGQPTIMETVNQQSGLFSKQIRFDAIGSYPIKITLSDENGNKEYYENNFSVRQEGMSYVLNSQLIPNEEWTSIPDWNFVPMTNKGDGWYIKENDKTPDQLVRPWIAFWKEDVDTGEALPLTIAITQTIKGLPNGTYTLSVWYEMGNGVEENLGYDETKVQLRANNYKKNMPATVFRSLEEGSWTKIELSGIVIESGECTVGMYITDMPAKSWGSVVDFSFVRQR